MIEMEIKQRLYSNPQWLINWYKHVEAKYLLIQWKLFGDEVKLWNGRLEWSYNLAESAILTFDNDEDFVLFVLRWS